MMFSAAAFNTKNMCFVCDDDEQEYFEKTSTGIIYIDSELAIVNLNREAERIFGIDRYSVIGKKADHVFDSYGQQFSRVFHISECDHLYTTNVKLNLGEQAMYLHVNTLKLLPETGCMAGMIVIVQDISAVRAAIKQIQTTQMLVSLGELAAGVAHHIRTPLTMLSGYLQVMMKRLEDDQCTVKRDMLEGLLSEASYINDVIKELVLFAKPPLQKEPGADINRIIQEALLLTFKDLDGANVSIVRHLADALPLITADANLLKQALVNIMQNAVEAMPVQGTLTVKSWLNRESSMLVIAISDTGSGIQPETMARIFEPFYTTKLDRIGLGLPIAHRIVSEHGGFLHMGADEPGGVKVHIYLPIIATALPRGATLHQQILNLQ